MTSFIYWVEKRCEPTDAIHKNNEILILVISTHSVSENGNVIEHNENLCTITYHLLSSLLSMNKNRGYAVEYISILGIQW